jgi:hypothetical protein
MKSIKEIYSGFIRLRRDRKKGTFNIGTYEEILENESITDHTGCKLLVSEILEKRPARGNFESTRPMVYVVKAKITYRPEPKV